MDMIILIGKKGENIIIARLSMPRFVYIGTIRIGAAPIDLSGSTGKNSRAYSIYVKRGAKFMEGKVLLYDVDGKKIGETFMRRAQQLVKQQRAVWTDESQTAARFITDAVIKEEDAAPTPIFDDEEWIVDLAKRRIRQGKVLIIHFVVFFPALVAIIIGLEQHEGLMVFLAVALVSGLIGHCVGYAILMTSVDASKKGGRQSTALEKEIANIKKQLGK